MYYWFLVVNNKEGAVFLLPLPESLKEGVVHRF